MFLSFVVGDATSNRKDRTSAMRWPWMLTRMRKVHSRSREYLITTSRWTSRYLMRTIGRYGFTCIAGNSYRLTLTRQNGSSEAEAEFNAQIAKISADIERVAPNMKAMDRCVQS